LDVAGEYSLVEYDGKKVYVATAALEKVFTNEKKQPLEYTVLSKVKGKKLVGKRYHPLFENHGPAAHRVLSADFVTAEDGTGIVHEAPAYGEEDYDLCKKEGVPILSIVDENGAYTSGRWLEKNIWDVNKEIAKTLVAEGNALKVEYIQHDYPHCHRCGTKLMYRAHPSWFMDIQDQKQEMQDANAETSWTPSNLRDGRFANIIESAPDWNLSRDRYWATPLPVWKGNRQDGTEVIKVVGSYAELKELTGKSLDDYHLPNVMDITFEVDGIELKHIGKVIDCWFESGSMPFAQFHYPFENVQKFEQSFPADFIIEAIDQTRGWFYSLTAVNVGLFGKSPFKNLICTGFINAADGKKMSKKLKNYTDPNELMDAHGADSFRFLLMGSPLLNGEDFALKDKEVLDVQRKLSMAWNMYDFFTLYAEVDGWEYKKSDKDILSIVTNPLDVWIISRVHQLAVSVDTDMNNYNIQNAVKPILPFIDDASNWFVRRSRKRFWKSDNDGDKQDAYATLHYVLVELSKILAPFTPFMSEALYKKLTDEESVHLTNWPTNKKANEEVIQQMAVTRAIIEQGLGLRMVKSDTEDQVKVRQPLSTLTYSGNKLDSAYEEMIAEEVNVKAVKYVNLEEDDDALHVQIDKKLTPELLAEGNAREIVRLVQSARKKAGLNVDDRITLQLESTDKNIQKALQDHADYIAKETLATVAVVKDALYQEESSIGAATLAISLTKA
jgi:isoleucyl-tRNA synthetase